MYKKPFAVFLVAINKKGKIAATTRPYEGKDKIGLPGGKIDFGETPLEALYRECKEEGWLLPKDGKFVIIHEQLVMKRLVRWYLLLNDFPRKLKDYKEKPRGIRPILVTKEELRKSGMGNENLPIYDDDNMGKKS